MPPNFGHAELPRYNKDAQATALMDQIASWVHSEPLTTLVETFGGADLAGGESLGQELDKLDSFSDRWDFRRGKERNLAQTADFASEHEELIIAAAEALGMVRSAPPRHAGYDHVIILGGLVRACILRPRLAAELLDGHLTTNTVTAIGAFRPLRGDEHDLAAGAGLENVDTEFEAMDAGIRRAFALGTPSAEEGEKHTENPNLSWHVRTYKAAAGSISVVAAPTTDPERRANTPDSYRYWAENLAEVEAGQRVLLVTSTIYIPFQHTDAIRMLGLPYGAEVDTVGVDTTMVSDEKLRQTFAASGYLQEVRSAIRSMRALVAAIDQAATHT